MLTIDSSVLKVVLRLLFFRFSTCGSSFRYTIIVLNLTFRSTLLCLSLPTSALISQYLFSYKRTGTMKS